MVQSLSNSFPFSLTPLFHVYPFPLVISNPSNHLKFLPVWFCYVGFNSLHLWSEGTGVFWVSVHQMQFHLSSHLSLWDWIVQPSSEFDSPIHCCSSVSRMAICVLIVNHSAIMPSRQSRLLVPVPIPHFPNNHPSILSSHFQLCSADAFQSQHVVKRFQQHETTSALFCHSLLFEVLSTYR